jgi:hypothetical protein
MEQVRDNTRPKIVEYIQEAQPTGLNDAKSGQKLLSVGSPQDEVTRASSLSALSLSASQQKVDNHRLTRKRVLVSVCVVLGAMFLLDIVWGYRYCMGLSDYKLHIPDRRIH